MNPKSRALRRHSTSPAKSEQPFLKYLKPGALAYLRNSRISARSHRLHSLSLVSLHCTTSSSPPNDGQPRVNAFDDLPCFFPRSYAPRCPQRKKLVAARSVLLLNPSSQVPEIEPTDVFSADGVAAH